MRVLTKSHHEGPSSRHAQSTSVCEHKSTCVLQSRSGSLQSRSNSLSTSRSQGQRGTGGYALVGFTGRVLGASLGRPTPRGRHLRMPRLRQRIRMKSSLNSKHTHKKRKLRPVKWKCLMPSGNWIRCFDNFRLVLSSRQLLAARRSFPPCMNMVPFMSSNASKVPFMK